MLIQIVTLLVSVVHGPTTHILRVVLLLSVVLNVGCLFSNTPVFNLYYLLYATCVNPLQLLFNYYHFNFVMF